MQDNEPNGHVEQLEDVLARIATAGQLPETTPQFVAAEHVQSTNRVHLIQNVAQSLDAGLVPKKDLVSALFGRVFRDCEGLYFDIDDLPAGALEEDDQKDGPYDNSTHPIKNDELQLFPGGIYDADDSDGVLTIALVALEKLPPDQQPSALREILDQFYNGFYDEPEWLITDLLSVAMRSPAKDALFSEFLDFIYRTGHDSTQYDESTGVATYGRFDYDHPALIVSHLGPHLVETIRGLAHEKDDEKVRKLLGIFIENGDYVSLLNTIRYTCSDQDTDIQTKTGLERVGKILIGQDPNSSMPFFTSLDTLYESIHFEEYPLNEKATEFDVEFVEHAVQSIQSLHGTIVDLASGTGRISNALASRGIDNILAVEPVARHIEVAKQGDHTGKVIHERTDWKNIPLANNSAKAVICLGRSLPHTENHTEFRDVIGEVSRVTMVDGLFLLEMPAMEGDYKKNRDAFRELMKTLGVTTPVFDDIVIDGPEAGKLYNRYVPELDTIQKTLRRLGFAVDAVMKKPIEGSNGDSSYYITARKVADLPRSMLNSTTLSAFSQSPGGESPLQSKTHAWHNQ